MSPDIEIDPRNLFVNTVEVVLRGVVYAVAAMAALQKELAIFPPPRSLDPFGGNLGGVRVLFRTFPDGDPPGTRKSAPSLTP